MIKLRWIEMLNGVTDSLTLKASKGRFQKLLGVAVVFLLIALLGNFPHTLFFLVFRVLLVPACLFAMVVFMTAIFTNKYDAVLNHEGIEFGSFYRKEHFKWDEIKATGVIRPVTGKRVFIELNPSASSKHRGRQFLRYLPDNYGMDADELAKMLLRWQREYGNVKSN